MVDVVPFTPQQSKQNVESWIAAAKSLPAIELAQRLGITDRQARRIKTGDITAGCLLRWAEEKPELMAR